MDSRICFLVCVSFGGYPVSFKFFELRVRWCQDKPWLGGIVRPLGQSDGETYLLSFIKGAGI